MLNTENQPGLKRSLTPVNYPRVNRIAVIRKPKAKNIKRNETETYGDISLNSNYSKEVSFNPKTNKNFAEFLKTNRSKLSSISSAFLNSNMMKNSLTPDKHWHKYAGINGKKKEKLEVNLKTKSLRRKAYAHSINPQNQKETEQSLERICRIQNWWKKIFKVIKIQKRVRGFLFRNCSNNETIQEIKILKIAKAIKKIFWNEFKKILGRGLAVEKLGKVFHNLKRKYFKMLNKLIKEKQKLKKMKIKKEAADAFFDSLSKKNTYSSMQRVKANQRRSLMNPNRAKINIYNRDSLTITEIKEKTNEDKEGGEGTNVKEGGTTVKGQRDNTPDNPRRQRLPRGEENSKSVDKIIKNPKKIDFNSRLYQGTISSMKKKRLTRDQLVEEVKRRRMEEEKNGEDRMNTLPLIQNLRDVDYTEMPLENQNLNEDDSNDFECSDDMEDNKQTVKDHYKRNTGGNKGKIYKNEIPSKESKAYENLVKGYAKKLKTKESPKKDLNKKTTEVKPNKDALKTIEPKEKETKEKENKKGGNIKPIKPTQVEKKTEKEKKPQSKPIKGKENAEKGTIKGKEEKSQSKPNQPKKIPTSENKKGEYPNTMKDTKEIKKDLFKKGKEEQPKKEEEKPKIIPDQDKNETKVNREKRERKKSPKKEEEKKEEKKKEEIQVKIIKNKSKQNLNLDWESCKRQLEMDFDKVVSPKKEKKRRKILKKKKKFK
ncbi:MAG: hypothetical protein MJ252_15515 [archaeon]|nr:hypothetical protein [archaeon]